MPHIRCKCGHVINLSVIPCPHGFIVVSEERYDEFFEAAERLHKETLPDSDFRWNLQRLLTPLSPHAAPHIYQCTHCGRIAVFRNPSDTLIAQWYSPDKAAAPAQRQLRNLFDDPPAENESERTNEDNRDNGAVSTTD
jgi:hypothetical protein